MRLIPRWPVAVQPFGPSALDMSLSGPRPADHPAARDCCRAADVCSWRCPAGPTRSRCCTSCASSSAAASSSSPASAHFNHQLRGAEADADEAFCRALARALGAAVRGRARPTCARWRAREGARSRTRRAPRGTRFSTGRADRLGADAIAVGHSRRRSGGDVPAAVDARRRAARAGRRSGRGPAASSGRCSTLPRADLRALRGRARSAISRGRHERRRRAFRATGSATS